jgi:hypothetical protein
MGRSVGRVAAWATADRSAHETHERRRRRRECIGEGTEGRREGGTERRRDGEKEGRRVGREGRKKAQLRTLNFER